MNRTEAIIALMKWQQGNPESRRWSITQNCLDGTNSAWIIVRLEEGELAVERALTPEEILQANFDIVLYNAVAVSIQQLQVVVITPEMKGAPLGQTTTASAAQLGRGKSLVGMTIPDRS